MILKLPEIYKPIPEFRHHIFADQFAMLDEDGSGDDVDKGIYYLILALFFQWHLFAVHCLSWVTNCNLQCIKALCLLFSFTAMHCSSALLVATQCSDG